MNPPPLLMPTTGAGGGTGVMYDPQLILNYHLQMQNAMYSYAAQSNLYNNQPPPTSYYYPPPVVASASSSQQQPMSKFFPISSNALNPYASSYLPTAVVPDGNSIDTVEPVANNTNSTQSCCDFEQQLHQCQDQLQQVQTEMAVLQTKFSTSETECQTVTEKLNKHQTLSRQVLIQCEQETLRYTNIIKDRDKMIQSLQDRVQQQDSAIKQLQTEIQAHKIPVPTIVAECESCLKLQLELDQLRDVTHARELKHKDVLLDAQIQAKKQEIAHEETVIRVTREFKEQSEQLHSANAKLKEQLKQQQKEQANAKKKFIITEQYRKKEQEAQILKLRKDCNELQALVESNHKENSKHVVATVVTSKRDDLIKDKIITSLKAQIAVLASGSVMKRADPAVPEVSEIMSKCATYHEALLNENDLMSCVRVDFYNLLLDQLEMTSRRRSLIDQLRVQNETIRQFELERGLFESRINQLSSSSTSGGNSSTASAEVHQKVHARYSEPYEKLYASHTGLKMELDSVNELVRKQGRVVEFIKNYLIQIFAKPTTASEICQTKLIPMFSNQYSQLTTTEHKTNESNVSS